MSTSSNTFDLREMLSDLASAVKSRASEAGFAATAAKPDVPKMQSAVLAAVQIEAKNVKEIAESIALASAATWAPSVSELQPLIATLVEEKNLESLIDGDRKKYSITKAGKAVLKAAAKDATESRTKSSTSKRMLPFETHFLSSSTKLAPVMLDIAQTATDEQKKQAAQVLDETRHKLHAILAGK